MKRKFIFILTLFYGILLHAEIIESNELLHFVEKINNDSTEEIWFSNQQYTTNDTIFLWDSYVVCPFEDAWGVFIDYHPLQDWGHKCSYIFINKSNGEYVQIDKTLPPLHISEQWTKYRTFNPPTKIHSPKRNMLHLDNQQDNYLSNIEENQHLYAIIIDYCGGNTEYNYERLWNDCSAMYTAFRNNGYLREHIYVAMPDGSAGMPNLHFLPGDTIENPLDLDGDGINDIRYPATIHGVDSMFNDISSVLTENDILVVYLTGHGDFPLDYSFNYFGTLVDGNYYDGTLVHQLSALNVGILNMIIQRNSTYYLLNYNNIINHNTPFYTVISADDTRHNSYGYIDEYTSRWAQAVNNDGLYDLNNDGHTSMYEAHSYAISNNSDQYYYPYQDSKPVCLIHDLSLKGTLPSNPCIQSDLYIKDNSADYGREPNTSTELSYISPDIWIENPRGDVVDIPMSNRTYNVCVRVRNRGNEYSYGTETLHLHWTKAVIGGVWPNSWNGEEIFDCNGTSVSTGMEITSVEGFSLPIIPPQGEYIARIPWTTPNYADYAMCTEFGENPTELWHYCLLARIYEDDNTPGAEMEYQPMNTFVLNSNNVASRNITIMQSLSDNIVGAIVSVVAPYTGSFSISGRLCSFFSEFFNDDFTINLYLDNNLYTSWDGSSFGLTDEGDRFKVVSPLSEIQHLNLSENTIYTIKIEVENGFLPGLMYDIALKDEEGIVLGGERFQFAEYNYARIAPLERENVLQSESDLKESNVEIQQVLILNAVGQIIMRANTLKDMTMQGLPLGVYTVVLVHEDGTNTYKIIQQ